MYQTKDLNVTPSKTLTFKTPRVIIKQTRNDRIFLDMLTATHLKTPVFGDVAPCSLAEVYRRFRGVVCLHHHSPAP
jgi:hypothetical protein